MTERKEKSFKMVSYESLQRWPLHLAHATNTTLYDFDDILVV